MNVSTPRAQCHAPPAGWSPETFERLTGALAAALVASYRRDAEAQLEPPAGRDAQGAERGWRELVTTLEGAGP